VDFQFDRDHGRFVRVSMGGDRIAWQTVESMIEPMDFDADG
jgi:hypothetical protein